jgi:predicted ABC-type ATPase
VNQRQSCIFENVLSDPIGDKVEQLASYSTLGHTVVVVFIQIESAEESSRRVSMRACQGRHDVLDEKLRTRFDQTQANLQRAIQRLPHVIVFSNQDLRNPYQLVALCENGKLIDRNDDT